MPTLACVPDSLAKREAISKQSGSPLMRIRPGSVPGVCEKCGEKIWIGPRQQIFREHMGWPVCCMECSINELLEELRGLLSQEDGDKKGEKEQG